MPYERFLSAGPASLSNGELLALILRTGTIGKTATDLGNEILKCTDPANTDLSVLYDLSLEQLLQIEGIGEVKAVKILCLAEISRRIAMERSGSSLCFSSAQAVASYYMESLRHLKQERVLALFLDNRLGLLREEVLSIGTVNSTLLSPRDIYIRVLHCNAVNILLLHNHPSGDPSPSKQDIVLSGQIKQAGLMLDIPLLDHIVIGDGCYCSLKETGHL